MTRPHRAEPSATAAPRILDAEVAIEDDRWCSHPDIEDKVLAAVTAFRDSPLGVAPAASAVTIVLSDDARVAALNGNFRQKPSPTNVLSFPADAAATEPGSSPYLGDIIMARETVEREAAEQAIPVADHVQHLTLHGLLHLLDYDHLTDADAEEMEAIETQILASLDIPDPHSHPLEQCGRDTTCP